MTLPYEFNPVPHVVAVRCPTCQAEACFEFAEIVEIKSRQDIGYFENSIDFEVARIQAPNGQFMNVAIHYHGLKSSTLDTIDDLPSSYLPGEWHHPANQDRSLELATGTLVCTRCSRRAKHTLRWPTEAYYQIDYRSNILWAFNRESAQELLSHIRSENRERNNYRYKLFLMKIPSIFLGKKAREAVSKKLEKLLTAA